MCSETVIKNCTGKTSKTAYRNISKNVQNPDVNLMFLFLLLHAYSYEKTTHLTMCHIILNLLVVCTVNTKFTLIWQLVVNMTVHIGDALHEVAK